MFVGWLISRVNPIQTYSTAHLFFIVNTYNYVILEELPKEIEKKNYHMDCLMALVLPACGTV